MPGSFFRTVQFLLALTFVACGAGAHAQTTVAADRFVDSVGVNVHLHYDNTLYWDNFDLVRSRLIELGVRHVRDGLIDTTWQPYYDRHNALGAAGIKGVFIAAPDTSLQVMRDYPSRISLGFEAYKGPNEYDASGDANWAAAVRRTMTQLRSLRADPRFSNYPVYGPSLTSERAFTTLGDLGSLVDYANLHNYLGGRHPGTGGWGDNGYGSIDWNLGLVQRQSSGKPVVSTETGYWNDPSIEGYLTQQTAAIYMPRLLLEQFRKGIARTYIYELADFDQSPRGGLKSGYGLLNRDGSPKPAYTAVKNLLALLTDPGAPVAIRPLGYTVMGGGGNVRHMALQKRDNSYFVAVWLEQSSFDVEARRTVAVSAQTATLLLPDSVRVTAIHRWQEDGTVRRTLVPQRSPVPISIDDTLTVLEVRPVSVIAPPRGPQNPRSEGGRSRASVSTEHAVAGFTASRR